MSKFTLDDLIGYITQEEERTGLDLAEIGLYTVIKYKGGSITFDNLKSISKESEDELKELLLKLKQKGYIEFDGNTATIIREV
jgi:hypothetical protein